MKFELKTHYRAEFLPLIVSFVTEVARGLGATPKECSELGIAAEEAGAHIIARYPGSGLEEQFEVCCEDRENGLRVVFSNMGLPVNPQALPKYETDRPEETLEGLGLFLIERMVDHYEFINQGRAGWRTVLVKQLANPKKPSTQTPENSDDLAPSREKLRVLQAGLEHVPGIVELAYRNYGYTYSKDLFYYADRLRTAISDGRVQSFIALNPAGQIVGQMALLYSPLSPEIGEVGAVMVQPEYRRSMGLLQLIKAVIHGVRDQPNSPLIGESNLVTTHTLSQKVCAVFKFKPMALKLSVHDRAHFLQLAENDGQRESLLHAILLTRPAKPVRLFVPPPHAEITNRLFHNAEILLEQPTDVSAFPEQTALEVESHPDSGLAIVSVRVPGLDFAPVLRKQLFDLESDGMKTVFVRFPGWLPRPDTLENEARALRIFFCGWVAESPERWWLLYTRLNAQRFDFAQIQLCDPLALELRTYVETCFQKAVL